MRMQTVVVLFIGLLLNGCSLFGGGKNSASGLGLAAMQRAQWEELAKNGDSEAEYQLGLSYCCGFGPGHTQTTARHWFCEAALQGHAGAQFQLEQLFGFRMTKRRPMSMPPYPDYAHFWYSLAAAQGYELANTYRAAIEQDMTSIQLQHTQTKQTKPHNTNNKNTKRGLQFSRSLNDRYAIS